MPAPAHPLRRLALLLTALALLGAMAGVTPTVARPAAQPAQSNNSGRLLFMPVVVNGQAETIPPANISADLSIRPVPLSQVQRGTDLSVEYRFRNAGNAPSTARFSLFYPQRLINFEWLDAPNDRYIGHDNTRVIVEVRNVAPGTTRTGRINFLVLSSAPVGSRVGLFAEYQCRPGDNCQSNFAEVEVVANEGEGESGGTFAMAVSPDRGPPGTAHTFSGAFFRPGETFVTWLNTPSGVLPLPISGRADGAGRIQFTYGTGGLTQAGFYSMVAHGQQSNVQNVGPFIVQINGQPAATGALAPAGLAGAPAAPAAPSPAQTTGDGGIAGRVLDTAGAGVPAVPVEVLDATGAIAAVARSSDRGVYIVPTGLATGEYTVRARPDLNPELPFLGEAAAGPALVTAPELTPGVNLTLPAAGGLAGTVTSGGAGAPGVRVTAIDAGGAVAGSDLSDSAGAYSITHLPAGSYTLRFDPRSAARTALVSPASSGAQQVTAGQVAQVGAFDLSATPRSATKGAIGGRVTDAAGGAGIGDVLVVITSVAPASDAQTFVSVARTEDDGTYASDPLLPGDYRVQFVTLFSEVLTTTRYVGEFYDDAATIGEADPVTVAVGASATADAALSVGGSIGGTVSGDGAGPLADVLVIARDGAGAPRGLAVSDAAGAYTLSGLPAGTYDLEFHPSEAPGSAARAFYEGALTGVAVGAGAAVTGQDVTLSAGPRIAGTVSAGDTGEPLAEVGVIFFRSLGGGQYEVDGVAVTDAAGAYSSPALDAGSYTMLFLTAFSPDETTRTYQSEFFNNRASLATADSFIVPRFLGTVTRNVELAPGGRVAGEVSAADSGANLPGVAVVARAGGAIVGGAITDEAGEYSLAGLPAGEVELTFSTAASPDPAVRAYAGATATVTVGVGATASGDVELAALAD